MSDQFDWLRPEGAKGKSTDEPIGSPAEAPVDPRAQAASAAERRLGRGASWFYWIAALSLINSATYFIGYNGSFMLGLGISSIVDVFAQVIAEAEPDIATVVLAIGFVVSALLSGIFVLFGRLSKGGRQGAYVVGIALYALDSLLFLVFGDWLSFGFHVFALYWLIDGFRALRSLKQMRSLQPAY